MDERELARLREALTVKLQLIAELNAEAAELAAEINAEEQRRKDAPGSVHDFRPRPSNGGPADQGSL